MIHHGDLFDVLPTLTAASVDACVTDPPYELGFMGKQWDGSGVAFNVATWQAVGRVLKPGASLCAFGGTRTFHRLTSAIEDAGFEIRDCLSWLYGSGFPKSLNLPGGRGTALKPSWEPIILARKPLAGTVAHNVLTHGTGALNIDACRIDYRSAGDQASAIPQGRATSGRPAVSGAAEAEASQRKEFVADNTKGRWPANVLLDEWAAEILDEETDDDYRSRCQSLGPLWDSQNGRDACVRRTGYGPCELLGMPAGGASRFYYVAKPSREERDYGTSGLTERQRDDSRKAGNLGGDNPRNRGLQQRGNFHPTVKPVELMRWLVRLVTPPGGTVLDPFLGSGTTGMACRYEQRQFIGIELEADYIQIAERRIAAVAPLFGELEMGA